MIPYNRQRIEEDDVAAVCAVLRSDWLTTGPKVQEFEEQFAQFVGTRSAVSFNSGTAALHAMMHVSGIGPGDEVIVPAITFVATANAVRYVGAVPVFADVLPDSLCLDPAVVERLVSPKTKAVISVDYAGQPSDYDELRAICAHRRLILFADACHGLGGTYRGKAVGSLADFSAFSFHPVKPITTGEGGMVSTDNVESSALLRRFRNHGIDLDFREREQRGSWSYDMVELGWNYRLSDLACALGLSQLKKLPLWTAKRQSLADEYRRLLPVVSGVRPLVVRPVRQHAYHLFVIQLLDPVLVGGRNELFKDMRSQGIGAHILYQPVYYHGAYEAWRVRATADCPVAESVHRKIFCLPLHVGMDEIQVQQVVEGLQTAIGRLARS